MFKNDILISIILCCYNSEKFIKKTLDSIHRIKSDKIELILIDDGSTDHTHQILKNYSLNIPKKLYKQKNHGLAISRNKAIELSSGKWIAILDHDDEILIQTVNKFEKFILSNKHNNIGLFFGNTNIMFNDGSKYPKYINDKKNPINYSLQKIYCYKELLKNGCFIVSSTALFRKSLVTKVNGFEKKYMITCDYHFFLKLSLITDSFYINEVLCNWRTHENQATTIHTKQNYKELIIIYYEALFSNNKILNFNAIIYINFIKYLIKYIYISIKKIK